MAAAVLIFENYPDTDKDCLKIIRVIQYKIKTITFFFSFFFVFFPINYYFTIQNVLSHKYNTSKALLNIITDPNDRCPELYPNCFRYALSVK